MGCAVDSSGRFLPLILAGESDRGGAQNVFDFAFVAYMGAGFCIFFM